MDTPELITSQPAAVSRFSAVEARLAEFRREYSTLDLKATPLVDVNDARMPMVKDALKQLTACRTQTETVKDELKRDILVQGRQIDAEYAKRKAAILEIETPIRQEKERVDKLAKEEGERIVKEREAKEAAEIARLKKIEDDKIAEAKRIEDARIAAERKKLDEERAAFAEQQRIAYEKAQEEFKETQARAAAAAEAEKQAAAERKRRQDEEDAERARQKAAVEAQAAKIREEQEKLDRAKFEAETKRKAEEQAKHDAEENARREALRIRLEAEAKERDEKARLERETAEQRAEEEARPDKLKVQAWADRILVAMQNRPVSFTTKAAEAFVEARVAALEAIIDQCKNYGMKPGKAKVRA